MPNQTLRSAPLNSPALLEETGADRKHKGYRRYASNVERALALFDTALQEWADYIAFLGRLLKALQSKPSGTADVPHKALVAKRLAQCLDPTLPSGVHQKALEVYAYVFSTLDKDGLSRDLSLYLPGLAPTLSFASLSVKPALLSLFETFISPLDPVILRSALKAITLALLPGLEEETSEEFDRTLSLLNKFRNAVASGFDRDKGHSSVSGDQYYWQSFFLASITSPSRRQGALTYMVRELPPLGIPLRSHPESNQTEESGMGGIGTELPPQIEAVTTPEPGLLVRSFAAGLEDEQVLIQRGFLDLLVTHLPLHSAVLRQKVVPKDLELLVSAAAAVVVRREMSLNRRLWTWFLGPEVSSGPDDGNPSSPNSSPTITPTKNQTLPLSQTKYFEHFGLAPLVSSVLTMVADESSKPSEKARPFRICLSLMDRWEIGGLVVPQIFLPAMKSIWRYQRSARSKEALEEVLRSANVFFDAIESSLIWAELTEIVTGALKVKHSKTEEVESLSPKDRLDLVLFVITNFNVREEEMLVIHIPMVTLALIISLRLYFEAPLDNAKERVSPAIGVAIDIAVHLIDLIPAKFLRREEKQGLNTRDTGRQKDSILHILQDIEDFYHRSQRGTEDATPPFESRRIRDLLLHNTIRLVAHGLEARFEVACLEKEVVFLDKLLRKIQVPNLEDNKAESEALVIIMSSLSTASDACAARDGIEYLPFPAIAVLVSTLEMMCNASASSVWSSNHSVRQILPDLLTGLWTYISPAKPRHSVEAVRGLWRVHSVSPDVRLVEASISTLMLQDSHGHRGHIVNIEGARRFAILWAHSGPISKTPADRRLSSGHDAHQPTNNIKGPSVLAQPLLLVLDSLFEPKTELFMFTVGWLQSLSSIQQIIDFLIYRLDASPYFTHEGPSNAQTAEEGTLDDTSASLEVDDCLYYLQTILNLTKYSTANTSASFPGPLSDMNLRKGKQFGEAELSGPVKVVVNAEEPTMTVQSYLIRACIRVLEDYPQEKSGAVRHRVSVLRQTSASLLKQLLLIHSSSTTLVAINLEDTLIKVLSWSVEQSDHMLQLPLMDVILIVLRARITRTDVLSTAHGRPASRDTIRSTSQLSVSTEKSEKDHMSVEPSIQTSALLDCLTFGISSPNNHPVLEQWIRFLNDCLPFYSSNTFQILMPLVDTFSRSIESVFQDLQAEFAGKPGSPYGAGEPIAVLNALLNGLEQVLARGHDQWLQEEGHSVATKSPEQVQGFFGNMVSGVFASEAQKFRPTTANNRLTVLLCFKDAVRVSFNMWSWGDGGLGSSLWDPAISASFGYMSIRLRNRSRRILEHLFAAESLECLETLVVFWHKAETEGHVARSSTVFNLLHALEASRPKNTIPALFNAMYSRTNPNVLDPIRKSTLTSELSDINLAIFLVAYTRSMEDDALDEIWTDCMTFLRDVLSNPLPHRQNLPILLNFTAILGQKINNTNFGEQRKMRRDIGDLFVRLLAATFTIKPLAFSNEVPFTTNEEKGHHHRADSPELRRPDNPDDVVAIIASILPNISKILVDADRITGAITTISTHVLAPTFRWKTFPRNITGSLLDIMKTMSRVPEASRIWRKDVAEAFNDQRFFHTNSLDLVRNGWMQILRQWALLDKDRMPELLSRLSSPTSAGIMFGVGASSARLEADRKTQLNLRRVATLMLSADTDMFVINLGGIQEKLVDLMTATAASSPSSITRSEIYMVLRALVLKTSPVHLAPLWPIVTAELSDALASLFPTETTARDTYNTPCVLQAAKFLDTLLTLAPDDFQLREWLFVTDTVDAVYRPPDWRPVALVDALAETLDSVAGAAPHSGGGGAVNNPLLIGGGGGQQQQQGGLRKPLLTRAVVEDVPMERVVESVLRPFLRQLSINAFESTYRMEAPDRQACGDDLLRDLFDESTLV